MSLYYNLFINNTEPDKPPNLSIWVKPSIGQAFIIVNNTWVPLVGGDVVLSFVEGIFFRAMTISGSEPGSPIVGDIWLHTGINQAYMRFAGWSPFAGV